MEGGEVAPQWELCRLMDADGDDVLELSVRLPGKQR